MNITQSPLSQLLMGQPTTSLADFGGSIPDQPQLTGQVQPVIVSGGGGGVPGGAIGVATELLYPIAQEGVNNIIQEIRHDREIRHERDREIPVYRTLEQDVQEFQPPTSGYTPS